jgi:Ca2+-binding RTX toxin-like protein
MYGGRDNDTMFGDGGDDIMRGNLGLDVMLGGAGSDRMFGGGGVDVLNGGSGNDYLFGENGNDTLNGGAGNDSMTGGAGADVFVFEAQAAANYDKVKDFTNGDDKLDLSSFGFGSFADVQALTTDAGWALKLNFGGGNLLYLEGFALADFDVSDVIL